MPEIAEVRTVAKTLNKRIIGKKITGIDFIYDKIILGDKEEFKDIGCVSGYKKYMRSDYTNDPDYQNIKNKLLQHKK